MGQMLCWGRQIQLTLHKITVSARLTAGCYQKSNKQIIIPLLHTLKYLQD